MSTDIMASLCHVCRRFRMNISGSTRPRDMLLLLKDTLSIEDDKNCKMHVCLSPRAVRNDVPHPKCENFKSLSQFSH